MVPSHLKNWQDTAAFSADDNGITLESIESIESIVVMQSPFDRYQSSLLATTSDIRDSIEALMQSKCVRRKAPGELLEIFRLLPVKVDELDMGIIKANDHYVDDVELLIDSPYLAPSSHPRNSHCVDPSWTQGE
ncbi:uncharacterized protein N7525_011567 [Penicillium rubens]|uniref:uncharacterized protein n=1 Tax=Penicillium rubens TaxID=1108849 RepID=UPI002A5AB9AF|nr:uncharacterized protein N7525_011567 [Penicillium rubens]KAJ5822283.1 hypothetical protein N7525_011567 [Penicillium rubens]